MINFEVKLADLTLYIDEQYDHEKEGIANKFCNTGGVKSKGHKLNTWFEGFIYTALIGINIDSRIEYKKRKEKSRRWDSFRDQLGFVFMKALSKNDVRNELKILNYEQINSEDYQGVDDLITKASSIIGEYSNGGLKYLQDEYSKDDSLFDSLYALEKIYEETIPEIDQSDLLQNEEEERTKSLIQGGENQEVEYKSTLKVNLFTKKDDDEMEWECMKNIAAFLNTKGGTLLIGVEDNKNILGLDADFNSFTQKKDKKDQFLLHLDNRLTDIFSSSWVALIDISLDIYGGKEICSIKVKKSSKPYYYSVGSKNERKKGKSITSRFYIRRNGSAIEEEGKDHLDYIREHFK